MWRAHGYPHDFVVLVNFCEAEVDHLEVMRSFLSE